MRLEPSSVAGVELIGPGTAEFHAAVEHLLGRAPDENVVTVPVHVPAGRDQTFSADPAEVQVTLRGDPKIIKNLRKQDIRAEVDLTGIESANGLLRPVEIILPQGVAYSHLVPDEVEVRVAPKQ